MTPIKACIQIHSAFDMGVSSGLPVPNRRAVELERSIMARIANAAFKDSVMVTHCHTIWEPQRGCPEQFIEVIGSDAGILNDLAASLRGLCVILFAKAQFHTPEPTATPE